MIVMEEIQGVVREVAKLFADRAAAGKIREKGAYDYVTAVDEAVQHFMQKKLGELYRHFQFMGEEKDNSAIDMNGFVWVLDPVDGTTNLVHDYRNSAISLALMSNKEVILGIVYNPFSDEMYYAQKGKGSFLNGRKIHVSDAKTMEESLISIGTSPYFKEEAEENFKMFSQIFKDCQD
ncbi:MAG: inositol monophosphatase, partial [Lachnospiraceae bacterium]|nr:inositol monophosphatase [Lachnospiraceae bacterium]